MESTKFDPEKCAICKEVAQDDILERSWCKYRLRRACTNMSANQLAIKLFFTLLASITEIANSLKLLC